MSLAPFSSDTMIVSLSKPSPSTKIPLRPLKNSSATLQVQVHVGARASSTNLNVFEATVTLPTFCMFVMSRSDVEADKSPPKSSVSFSVASPYNKVVDWIEKSFVLTEQLGSGAGGLQVKFTSMGTGGDEEKLWIQVKRDEQLKIKIGCNSMDLAGDIIQDLSKFLKITELESEANFPNEMMSFGAVLANVTEYNSARTKLTADMADSSNRVKALVVKCEDARQLGEMEVMRALYASLFHLNGELIGEYAKRSNNHVALLDALKSVNVMISRASNLRCGKAKARVVTECRAAIKANSFDALFNIVANGTNKKK